MVNWGGGASYLDLNGHAVTGETLGNEFTNSQLLNSAATTATWAGAVNLWAQTRFSATGAGNLVVSGNLAQSGTVQVDASGGGFVVLSGSNTNTGYIVDSNSRLVAGSAQAFGTAAGPTVIPSWAAWGVVDVNGQNIAAETFQNDLANGVLSNMAATNATWGGPVVGNAQLRFLAGSTGDLNITGAISGTSIQVDSGGGGAVVLSGNNTFTGDLNIHEATVRLGSANALGTTGSITRIVNWSGGYTALDVNGQTITGETFENNRVNGQLLNTGGNATWAGNVVANEQTRLTAGAGSLTVSGVVSGTHLQVDGGNVILSGNNTYTGETLISAGTLSVSQARFADAADIRLSGSAVLNLNFSGTDTIRSLYINGSKQAGGTWGAIGSAAQHQSPLITGTAFLQVGNGAKFSDWAAENGITGELPEGDFDHDGIANLLEYALGLSPTAPSASPGTFDGSTITFNKGSVAFANGDVSYAIQISTTLAAGSWTTVTPTGNSPSLISYTLPSGLPKVFARLVVTALN